MPLALEAERFSDTRFIARSLSYPETPNWPLSSHLRVLSAIYSYSAAQKERVGLLSSPPAFENAEQMEKCSNEKY